MINSLIHHRSFIISAVKTEFANRFVKSKLGFGWLIIQPLVTALILTFVLSQIIQTKFPGVDPTIGYAAYLLSGVLAWTAFTETFLRSLNVFIENKTLIQKTNIPRVVFPAILLGQLGIQMSLMAFATLFVLKLAGLPVTFSSLILFPMLLVTLVISAILGTFFGILNVFSRDIGQFFPVAFQLAFWATPIVYQIEILPKEIANYMSFNPFLYLITPYQDLILYSKLPALNFWIGSMLLITVLALLFIVTYKRASNELVDEL